MILGGRKYHRPILIYRLSAIEGCIITSQERGITSSGTWAGICGTVGFGCQVLVPGHKYPKTGIKEIYGNTSVRVCAPIQMITLHFRVLMAWDKYILMKENRSITSLLGTSRRENRYILAIVLEYAPCIPSFHLPPTVYVLIPHPCTRQFFLADWVGGWTGGSKGWSGSSTSKY